MQHKETGPSPNHGTLVSRITPKSIEDVLESMNPSTYLCYHETCGAPSPEEVRQAVQTYKKLAYGEARMRDLKQCKKRNNGKVKVKN